LLALFIEVLIKNVSSLPRAISAFVRARAPSIVPRAKRKRPLLTGPGAPARSAHPSPYDLSGRVGVPRTQKDQ